MLRTIGLAHLDLGQLVGSVIGLDDVPDALVAMNDPVPAAPDLTVVDLTAAVIGRMAGPDIGRAGHPRVRSGIAIIFLPYRLPSFQLTIKSVGV